MENFIHLLVDQSPSCSLTGPCSVSNYRSRGCEFDPSPVPYVEIDQVTIFYGHSHSASRRAVVSYKLEYVHNVLVNHIVKLAWKKCGSKG